MSNSISFPALIELEDFFGNFQDFEDSVYAQFKKDFIDSKPNFEGKPIALKIHPITVGKEVTYYHITHEGSDEQNRTPDLRRMERITFSKIIIENSSHKDIRVWRNKRNGKERILLFHEKERFLVILEDRKKYILFWTAYYIERNHRVRKLIKEYEEYIKKTGAA